jgi:hypothetical protein
MADFAMWGSAIAEVIGSTQSEFLKFYHNNIEIQKETILNENVVAMVLITFMEERSWEKWEGTATELLKKLTEHAPFVNVETKEKYWPKAPNVLSRALNIVKVTLRSADISVISHAGQSRKITVERISSTKSDSIVTPITGTLISNYGSDDNDDKNDTSLSKTEGSF